VHLLWVGMWGHDLRYSFRLSIHSSGSDGVRCGG
jgi:hypothetical protein